MGRIVKEPEVRKNEILDTANALFFTRSYEDVSIQEIIDAVGIAKGTFYHYFRSKEELLDALVSRMSEGILKAVNMIITDTSLSAVEKLNRVFEVSAAGKAKSRAVLLPFIRVLYRDSNILLRHRMMEQQIAVSVIPLAAVIRQGVNEGVFQVRDAETVMELILRLGAQVSEKTLRSVLEAPADKTAFDLLIREYKVYEESVERILGAPKGSIRLVNREKFRAIAMGTEEEHV